ncbi:MAG: ATP-binding protein [Bacteroidota bacterium]
MRTKKGDCGWGRRRGGLHIYDPQTGALKILNSDQGLGNNTVASVTVDQDGDRWLGTYNGISLVTAEGELITNLYEEDGLANRECNRYASLTMKDGILLIGTIKGLNIINPQRIKNQLKQAEGLKIFLTSLAHYNRSSRSDTLKRYGLNTLETIDMPASKRYLDLRFAVSNYFKADKNIYAYKLEGLDEDWIPLGNRPQLSLTNMPAGKYRLLIRGGDGVGNWTSDPLAINIHAREYFYRQFWFYPLCLLIIVGLAGLWISRLRTLVHEATQKIREDKELIEQQAEQLKELDKAKSRFFTNISHEFQTPLTIILGMANQIGREPELWTQKGLQMIKRNSGNLLRLINQILDLRKLESMAMDIQYIQGDIIQYLQYITESFESYTKSKGLTLHFLTTVPRLQMDYDPDKLMKIIANLLSNAIKYTPAGEDIYFHLDQKEVQGSPFLQIRVEDTGSGIPKEQLPNIFDRFFKAESEDTPGKPGTGIGLALTKELVELLKGSIEVNSALGKGTTFIVSLPITKESSIEQGEVYVEPMPKEEVPIAMPELEPVVVPTAQEDLPRILVVEDNKDVQEYIISCLQNNYQLDLADNGEEGVEKAIESIPDIIISDVMMPKKNGYELTAELKEDERSSHIPIVLLTSRVDTESRISGLEKGADIYLGKPFEPRELELHLRNLLETRKRLQQRYALVPPPVDPADPLATTAAAAANPFLEKIQELVEANISETDFGISQLCRGLAMSRSQIFRKVKALTGHSPSVFVRNIRLRKGKALLRTTDLTVSEVAYEVGFSSPNYFSRTFSAAYGFPPADLRQQ